MGVGICSSYGEIAMFCTRCGSNVSLGNAFCSACGTPLDPDSPMIPDPSASVAPKPQASPKIEPATPDTRQTTAQKPPVAPPVFCVSCGHRMESGKTFCTNCSQKISETIFAPIPAPPQPVLMNAPLAAPVSSPVNVETARLAEENFIPPSQLPKAMSTAQPVGKNRLMVAMISSVVLIAVAIGAYFGRDSIKEMFSKQHSGTSAPAPPAQSQAAIPAPVLTPAPVPTPTPAPTQASTPAPASSPKSTLVRVLKPAATPSPTPKDVQTPASAPLPTASPIPIPAPVPAPTQVHVPKPAPVAQRGVIQWSGEVKKNQTIVIERGAASAGIVNGRLPRVPCTIVVQPSDVSIAEAPAPSNGYDRIVLRFPRKERIVVTINWELLH
jgi:hypothetical protein